MSVCCTWCMHLSAGAYRGQRARALLELRFQAVLCYLTWIWESNESSARAELLWNIPYNTHNLSMMLTQRAG